MVRLWFGRLLPFDKLLIVWNVDIAGKGFLRFYCKKFIAVLLLIIVEFTA